MAIQASYLYQKYWDMLRSGKSWGETANLAKKETGANWDQIDKGLNKTFWAQGRAYGKYNTAMAKGQDLSGFAAPVGGVKPVAPTPVAPTPSGGGGGGGGAVNLPAAIAQGRTQAQKDAEMEQYLREAMIANGVGSPFVDGTFDEAAAKTAANNQWDPYFQSETGNINTTADLGIRGANEDWQQTATKLVNKKESEQFGAAAGERNLTTNLQSQGTARSGVGARQMALARLSNQNTMEGLTQDETAAGQIKDFNLAKVADTRTRGLSDLTHNVLTGKTTDIETAKNIWGNAEATRLSDYNKNKTNAQLMAIARLNGSY